MTFDISEPGKFEFSKPSYIVREGSGKAQIYVNRINGADGTVSVRWQTKDMSAKSNKDYVGADGILAFSHGETQKTVDILIIDTDVSLNFRNATPFLCVYCKFGNVCENFIFANCFKYIFAAFKIREIYML